LTGALYSVATATWAALGPWGLLAAAVGGILVLFFDLNDILQTLDAMLEGLADPINDIANEFLGLGEDAQIAATAVGALAGAVAGFWAGGPVGAVAGGVIGAGAMQGAQSTDFEEEPGPNRPRTQEQHIDQSTNVDIGSIDASSDGTTESRVRRIVREEVQNATAQGRESGRPTR
jgi:hypothetical protein